MYLFDTLKCNRFRALPFFKIIHTGIYFTQDNQSAGITEIPVKNCQVPPGRVIGNVPFGRVTAGRSILLGVDDESFCIMERASGKLLLEAPLLETVSSGMGTVAQISGDGRFCALAGQTKDGTLLRIHDLETKGHYECKIAKDGIIDDMAWITDTSLALLERFRQTAIWTLDKKIEKAPVTFTGSGSRIAVSPDKRLLASYEAGVSVTISEIESGRAIAQIYEPLYLKYGTLGFISDDKIMITGGGVISVFQFCSSQKT